ncbi:putative lipid-binding transport protein (Tim44 family) [Rhodobacteraceae bacterium MBR-64]|jgi:predicted lipid-binding transport protein (Tim44 family)
MSSAVIQLLVLIGIAIFLILRLKRVLGTREGFEKPPLPTGAPTPTGRRGFEVIEGGADADITDHVAEGSNAAKALAAMKMVEPGFNVGEFLHGARGAYEMILMAYERGDLDSILPFLSRDVYETLAEVVEERERKGLKVESTFVGIRQLDLLDATYDRATDRAEIKVRFVGELTSVVRDASGEVVEGDANEIRQQKDIWTFGRQMGSDDPNWQLVATGD